MAHARSLSDCDASPYGSTHARYDAWVQGMHEAGLTSLDAVKKICIAQARPGQYRDAMHGKGFTDTEILEGDPVELAIKFIAIIVEEGQRERGEQ
jgi:hypothetical protein